MKALKVSLVISAVVIFSVACSQDATNSNSGANQNGAVASSQAQNGNAAAGGTAVNANTAGGANANATMTTSGSASGAAGVDAAALFNGGVTPKCSGCHGEDGKGKLKGTPDFTSQIWQDKQSTDDLADAIIKGEGEGAAKMPAFRSKLTDEQIKALVGYVRSFAKK